MADPPPFPGAGDGAGVRPDRGSGSGPPRWVSVLGIIFAIVLVVLVVVLHLTGAIGPGAH